ncbi:TonB-dependent receptor, partial [Parabacteroides sp. OttesenSCG-928-K15]|nr:TonB-dependent receptor [Parabacteroides sp. OttesenSCG-928-K15]
SDEIDNNQKVSIHAEDKLVSEVLNEITKDNDLAYKVTGKHIIITKIDQLPALLQAKGIIGRVVDERGEPIIGANVVEKGTTNGVITNVDGSFSITVGDNASLVVTYIGYIRQEIPVGNQTSLQIILKEDLQRLEEVVVVGYGTQKKVNLTGSVGSVTAKELVERPQPNVQNMLQGKIPGLQVTTPIGQPGRDHGEILIRGKGSFGASSAPLILVDGLVSELNTLSADDIESISVLKDAASASIYGARAANGVILVTTKRGKSGKPQVSYSFNYGFQEATRLDDQIWDSATYMEMFNQMVDRIGGRTKYRQEMIDKYKDPNRDKNLYPDYNWMKETFGTGYNMTHNLSMMGGSDKITYNISLGYLNQEGILDQHNYERYTALMSLEAQAHERIKIGATAQFYYGKTHEPYYTNQNLTLMIMQSRPMTKPYLPDGSGRYSYENFPESYGGEWLNRNPVWAMNDTERNIENWIGNAQLNIDVDFIKKENMNLIWTTKGGFRFSNQFQNTHYPAYPQGYYYLKESDYLPGGRNEHLWATDFFPEKGVSNYDQRVMYTMLSSMLNFNWNITDDHEVTALLGVQEEGQVLRSLSGRRDIYPSDSMKEINGGSTVGQTLSGGITQYAIRSLFGRATYAYRSKYLFEANFRYDGTSRIHADNRWGFFPSVSGGWRISEEAFMKENLEWMDNLKLRVTYGKLGNSEIGNYPYQDVYSSSSYIFNGAAEQGVVQNALKEKSLKWETTTVTDIGLDMNLGNGLFSLVFDWYNKVTDGILSAAPIPASVGMSAPTINYGKLQNRGVEFELGHRNKIGDFTYGASFQATLNRNKTLELRAPSYGSYIYEVGKPYGEHYLYIWDGIFQSEEDIANSARHPNNPKPGDIKFKDLDGSGVIDGKDREMVKGVHPKMLYSFNLDFGYKNFDLSMFFQGIEGRKIWTNFFGEDPFSQGSSPNKKFLNAWTPENRDTDVPALYAWGYAPMTGTRSTYNLKDASYLRLKNLQLGYNVPKHITQKVGIDFLRIYFSGENLLTFTPYPDYDPERGGDGWHTQYPQVRTYSFGLNLRF